MEYKTNVIRILEKNNIKYQTYSYVGTEAISGIDVANVLDQDPAQVFKTLVTRSKSGKFFVFIIPVECELDLKKCAAAVNEKSIEMIKTKELFPLTGYIHGGCSPIGMKKLFRTVIDASAKHFDVIIFSAGKIGYQVEVSLADLAKVIPFGLLDVIKQS